MRCVTGRAYNQTRNDPDIIGAAPISTSKTNSPPTAGTALPRVLRALAEAARAYPLERKLLVCARPAHGRELLRALAHAGVPWMGFDVATPAQLALELMTPQLAVERVRP